MLASVDALAAEGRLDPEPLPRRLPQPAPQHAHVDAGAVPGGGRAAQLRRHPAVFQYVPGRGMQLHPLATWGQVNARLRACLRRARRLRGARLRRRLDALARLAAQRGGFAAWEYYYAYAQGYAAVDERDGAGDRGAGALARGAGVPGAALRAAGAARARRVRDARRPTGVAVPADGGSATSCTRSRPTLQILNGELQAINGLRDAAVLGRSRPRGAARARRRPRGARRARRLRHRRLVALLRRGRRVDALLPPAHDAASSASSAAAPAAWRTAAPSAASPATSASRRGSGSRRCAGSGRGAARRCSSRCRRARRCRCASRARAASCWRSDMQLGARRPRAELHAAVARPLPRARVGARAGGAARPLGPRRCGSCCRSPSRSRSRSRSRSGRSASGAGRPAARAPPAWAASGCGCGCGRASGAARGVPRAAAVLTRPAVLARRAVVALRRDLDAEAVLEPELGRRTWPPRAPGRRART